MLQLRPAPGVPLHHGLVACRKQHFGVVQAGGHQVPEIRRRQRGEHGGNRFPRVSPACRHPRQHAQELRPGKGVQLRQPEVHGGTVNLKLDILCNLSHL